MGRKGGKTSIDLRFGESKFARVLLLALLAATVLSFSINGVLAHELYLELETDGEIGVEHTIDLFWGHFPDAADPESSYFDEVMDGQLYVLSPTGGKSSLQLEKLTDRYRASFTPETGGDFLVIFEHNRGVIDFQHGEPQGPQAIIYAVKSLIDVHADEEIEAWDQLAGLELEIKPLVDIGHLHVGDEMKGQVLYKGQPLPEAEVILVTARGDSHEGFITLTTDEDGIFGFEVDMAGPWMIKVDHFDDGITIIDDEDVLGARYRLTMFVEPHEHEDELKEVAAEEILEAEEIQSETAGIAVFYYLIAGGLVVAAVVLFVKSRKS